MRAREPCSCCSKVSREKIILVTTKIIFSNSLTMSARRKIDAATVEEGTGWCKDRAEHEKALPLRKKVKEVTEALGSAEKESAARKRESSMMEQRCGTMRVVARNSITAALRFVNDNDQAMIGKSEEEKASRREETSIEMMTEMIIESWAIVTDATDDGDKVNNHARAALSGVFCTSTKTFDCLVALAITVMMQRGWDGDNYRAYLTKRAFNWEAHTSEQPHGLLEQECFDPEKDYLTQDVANVGGYSPIDDTLSSAGKSVSAVVTAAAAAAGSVADNKKDG